MSFGYSVGDVIATIRIAKDLRKRFVDAPDNFQAITSDVKSLSFLLEEVDDILPHRDLSKQQERQLHDLCKACQSVLEDLEQQVSKYFVLAPNFHGKRGKMRVAWTRLQWDQKEIDGFRDRLTLNVSGFNTFLQCLTINTNFKLKATMDRFEILAIEQTKQKKRDELLLWFSPVDHASKQKDFVAERQDRTGSWLLESPEYQEWVSEMGKTMLCPGIPGAGKTILTSIVINHLQDLCRNEKDIGIAYYYFTYQLGQVQTEEAIFACLIKQLLQSLMEIPIEAEELHKLHEPEKTQPSLDELLTCFAAVAQKYSRVFVVLDALDEYHASNSAALRKLISGIFQVQKRFPLNFLATTRYISEITTSFKASIVKDIRAHSDDIKSYINAQMHELIRGRIERYPDVKCLIRSELLHATDGMFLLARLHMNFLKGQPRIGDLKRAVKNLPKGAQGLDETYDRAMARIEAQSDGDKKLAKSILLWVINAAETLSIDSLRDALAIEPGSNDLDEDFRPEPEDLDSLCAGLITVDQNTATVRLVHYTTQEYFERRNPFPEAHISILRACITYMSFNDFSSGPLSSHHGFEERLRRRPFYLHACRHWGYYVNASGAMNDEIIQFLKDSSAKIAASMQAASYESYNSFDSTLRSETGIHLAAYMGIDQVIKGLIDVGASSEAKDATERTPLSYAVMGGHAETAEFLLRTYRANPNVKTTDGLPLIFSFISKHQIGLVKKLLADRRTDLSVQDRWGTTLLLAATFCRDAQMVNLLSNHGRIDPNTKDADGRTALLLAVQNGQAEIVQQLLANSEVDVNVSDSEGFTPILIAAMHGHDTIIDLLIKRRDLDLGIEDDQFRGPLSYAAQSGLVRFASFLLTERRISADSQDLNKTSPLICAAQYGNYDMVGLLLEHGANINHQDDEGRTALAWAASEGRFQIVELLLAHGAHPDIKNLRGRTPLSFAASHGYLRIAELLIKHGADANSHDKRNRSPFAYAMDNGHAEAFNSLLRPFQASVS